MNLNSSVASSSQNLDLRQAVEQQLDLILKMEEERKALKKQNKLLHMKIKQTNNILSKYQKQMREIEVNTDENMSGVANNVYQNGQQQNKEQKNMMRQKVFQEYGVQIVMDFSQITNPLNCSKLTQAQSLLKALQTNQSRIIPNTSSIQSKKSKQKPQKQLSVEPPHKTTSNDKGSEKQIATQLFKLTKQLNAAKRQVKQWEHKYKLREKQITDLKKCIETKNAALQKSRKQFNELSNIMNSDKMKSVRNMEQEINSLKAKLIAQEDSSKLKSMLMELTQEFQDYRTQAQKRIDILVAELANKEKEVMTLENSQKKMNLGA